MKIYLTKCPHTKYGSIKLTSFATIEDLVNNSSYWFDKPTFNKPLICDFTEEFFWRGFEAGINCSTGRIRDFPEGIVKEKLKEIIRSSIDKDFKESFNNRHYKWIGEVSVEIVEKKTSGNFNLYLTKPSVWDIQVAGLDRASVWLYPPILKNFNIEDNYFKTVNKFFYAPARISGNFFNKSKELNDITIKLWSEIINSFNLDSSDMDFFYNNITEENHKEGMSSYEFIKEFYCDIRLIED